MLSKGMKLATVKNQMANRFDWWKLHDERKFQTGDTSLFYKCGTDTLVLFFDKSNKLANTALLEL